MRNANWAPTTAPDVCSPVLPHFLRASCSSSSMCATLAREGCSSFPFLLYSIHNHLPPSPFVFCFASGILSAVYVVGLLACLLVGTLFGPDVFERSPPAAVETNSLNVTWYGAVNGMERYHQVNTEGLITQDPLDRKRPCLDFLEGKSNNVATRTECSKNLWSAVVLWSNSTPPRACVKRGSSFPLVHFMRKPRL